MAIHGIEEMPKLGSVVAGRSAKEALMYERESSQGAFLGTCTVGRLSLNQAGEGRVRKPAPESIRPNQETILSESGNLETTSQCNNKNNIKQDNGQ